MKEIVIAQPLGITRELLESLVSGLKKEGWNLTAYDKVPSGQEELGKRIEGADIAVIANYPLKKEALEKASSLKYLCVAFTGVDHVDISYCKERHIAVSNCAGYSTESVAELAFGMALSLYRMLPECGEAIRNGKTNAGLCGIELKEGNSASSEQALSDSAWPVLPRHSDAKSMDTAAHRRLTLSTTPILIPFLRPATSFLSMSPDR